MSDRLTSGDPAWDTYAAGIARRYAVRRATDTDATNAILAVLGEAVASVLPFEEADRLANALAEAYNQPLGDAATDEEVAHHYLGATLASALFNATT